MQEEVKRIYVTGIAGREDYAWEYAIYTADAPPMYVTGSLSIQPSNRLLGPILLGLRAALIQAGEGSPSYVHLPYSDYRMLDDVEYFSEITDLYQLIDERAYNIQLQSFAAIEEKISDSRIHNRRK